ncbi:MAG: hypothetical protein GY802_04230 [Gammaproteobacteria bacterium]|nr:hypothetical protein [Gammaproteobacteria bacterium]
MDKESALFYVVLLLFAATGIVTIMGMVQKVTIEKKYLNALFSALILELIAAVLYLFSNTQFFNQTPGEDQVVLLRSELPQANRDISPNDVLQMVANHDANQEKLRLAEQDLISLRSVIAAQVPPYDDVTLALDARIREIRELQGNLVRLETEQAAFEKIRENFLVRMAELNTRISDIGASINLIYQPENKREIAGMLQSAFKQIGFMPNDEMPNDDPFETNELMIRYQESKDFGQTGYLTSQVVALIILDYLSPISQNGNH